MLYGALGRTGVYPMQEMLRMIAGGDDDHARIALARRLYDDLPESNWLRRNAYVGDHLAGDDAGLYDLLLHARDRAYRVVTNTNGSLLNAKNIEALKCFDLVRFSIDSVDSESFERLRPGGAILTINGKRGGFTAA